MRLVARYVRREFLVTFGMTLLVITFVMCMMLLFRVTDIIAIGGPGGLIVKVFIAGLPSAMSFAIPMSALTAALLTFGRLSANGEIVAMKSSGLSMRQIAGQPLILAAVLSAIGLYLVADLVPTSYHARRNALRALGLETPLHLLEEGRCIREFPGFTFYFRTREGDLMRDIVLYQRDNDGSERTIRARSGRARLIPERKVMRIDLYDVRADPVYKGRTSIGHFAHMPLEIDVSGILGSETTPKKRSDMTFAELAAQIRNADTEDRELSPDQRAVNASVLRVEMNKRLVLAAASFAFVLLGIPLATRTHRRESSIGIGISLLVVIVFYLFVVVADTLAKTPEFRPHFIVWIPIVLSIGGGLALLRRVE